MTEPTGTSAPEPRDCLCHGVDMIFQPDSRYRIGGFYRCRVKSREKNKRIYENLSGFEYNKLLLRHRRAKALSRWREREAERG